MAGAGGGEAKELQGAEVKRIWGLVEGGTSSVDGSAWRCGRRPWRAAVASSDASRKGRCGLGDGGKHTGEVAGRRAREGSRTATRQQGFGGDARRERRRGQFGHGDHAREKEQRELHVGLIFLTQFESSNFV